MSGSPSNPRSSFSSQPSATSSSTLNSRYSSLNADLHAQSSSQTERSNAGRRASGIHAANSTSEDSPRSSRFLGDDLATKNGLGSRHKRARRSGGFLLEPTFPTEVEVEEDRRHSVHSESGNKGKRRAGEAPLKVEKRRSGQHNLAAGSLRGSSPLAREVAFAGDGQDREGSSDHVRQLSPSARGPLDQSNDHDESLLRTPASGVETPNPHPSQPPAGLGIDPTQIVQMALNLSESRRRNVSAGYMVTPPVASGRRVTSVGLPPSSAPLQGSYQGYTVGGSLRQHLQQQRRMSRNMSPGTGRITPGSRHTSTAHGRASMVDSAVGFQPGQPYDYQCSPATLARAEKARAHIELSIEYRRLLQYLPPLKPNSLAPGNSSYTTSSVPGTNNFELQRVQSHANHKQELGRSYNPLQCIRDRKLRARTRKILKPDVEEWSDVPRVKAWVDSVEDSVARADYRVDDQVALPAYGDDTGDDASEQWQFSAGHQKTDSIANKPKRPRMDWLCSPSELFADAYWLEQGDNKAFIEDRHGKRIFPADTTFNALQPRSSKEYQNSSDARRKSHTGSVTINEEAEARTGKGSDLESERGSERGRKRRHLLPGHRDDSSGHIKRHAWRVGRARSQSSSGLSSSDDGSSPRRRKKRGRTLALPEENTGPLKLRMNDILTREAARDRSVSPDLASPATPDKWSRIHTTLSPEHPLSKADNPDRHTGIEERLHGRLSGEHGSPSGTHSKKSSGPFDRGKEPRSSFEDLDTSKSATPVMKLVSASEMDPSPPNSRKASPQRKSKKSKLAIFRSDGSKRSRDNIDITDFAFGDSSGQSSRQPSGDTGGHSRNSLEVPPRNGSATQLASYKTNGSLVSLSGRPVSRGKKDGKDGKDTGSAVSRFFKGGRIGEIVRSEGAKVGDFIWKKDPPVDDTDSASVKTMDLSDLSATDDDEVMDGLKERPADAKRTATKSTAAKLLDARTSQKPHYHIDNLPTFKRTSVSEDSRRGSTATTSGGDHIYRQQLAQKGSRSPRFDRLAPPKMDLNNISGASSPDLSKTYTQATPGSQLSRRPSYGFSNSSSRSRSTDRLAAILDVPGGVGRGGLPVSGLARVRLSDKRSPSTGSRSRSNADSKRHWSISDQQHRHHASSGAISKADLARVQALLLCSGIKARELSRRAHSIRAPPPPFLLTAAHTAHAELFPVPRKEEHVLAARILATDLETTTARLHEAAARFRTSTTAALHDALGELRALVAETLTPRAHRCADDADAFTAELTTGYTLAIKRVNDRIEQLVRARRRRMRWVRRAGFVLLEWALLGVMWWVWLVVVVVRAVWSVVVGVGRGVRWVLWL